MKETVVVLFGGQSSEHVVSCMSAANVIDLIDREKYDLLLIGITEEGRWLLTESVEDIRSGAWRNGNVSATISPDATKKCVLVSWTGTQEGVRECGAMRGDARKCGGTREAIGMHGSARQGDVTGGAQEGDGVRECDGVRGARRFREVPVDVVFPVLHGLYGEDGTIQGLLELARIPYVGCGVLASAISMDKLYTKIVVDDLGIRQARYVPVMRGDLKDMDRAVGSVEAALDYPVFVKPSNSGSSRGVSKAGNRRELEAALLEAARHDRKILVEETIVGREVECAVFGGGKRPAEASGVGEILAAADFYDFDAKYHNAQSRTVTDPVLPAGVAETIRRDAVDIFHAVDGYGLSRVDFFVTEAGEVVFNEINTMPGFTAISMYPMLWEARGISKAQMVENLISHGKERYGDGVTHEEGSGQADAQVCEEGAKPPHSREARHG